jgi:hypothetical protein
VKHPQIEATLAARGGLHVALSFHNRSDHEAHLYRPNACVGGAVENNVFVVHLGAARIRYTGRYVKRGAPTSADFDVLPPRATRTVEVDLRSAYAVLPGATYAVRYEAFHDNPAIPASLWEVRSSVISVGP